MTYVSFPGLGIEPFHMNRVAFSIGKLDVYWYGILITVGMVLAVLYALHHAKIERVKSDDIIDLALALIVFGVIGARLYYVLMKLDTYIVTTGTFWENLCDTVLGMNLAHGGHLSHGSPVNMSGKYFNCVPYGVNDEGYIDYDELAKLPEECYGDVYEYFPKTNMRLENLLQKQHYLFHLLKRNLKIQIMVNLKDVLLMKFAK